ncbi:hypothetical protein RIF25_11780 [Thermosynechococcaceae cyanobacterium BACA0444]|uniref:Uncharacterized protein n=1 Tax=Pseudocalidococcus azoricus BACA0444 TaxID=2918990 RepID=A0AAE4FUW4_9CYAN|nr:hypothetical protein [Pseudocalidococcus azoricus]MDS3861486.1 hypothetical protein [Pseudocalidococcus azoricus BACA0444]
MKRFPGCEQWLSDKIIPIQENKSKINFLNPEQRQVYKLKIDGCAINDNLTPRCDYGLVPCTHVEIYIELKGRDVSGAIKQIESTIHEISSDSKKIKKLCFIICTQVAIPRTDQQNSQTRFKNHFNAILYIKRGGYEYDLTNCC